MSTAAAPVALRSSALAPAVRTGATALGQAIDDDARSGVGQAPLKRRCDGLVGPDASVVRDDFRADDEVSRAKPRIEPAADAPTHHQLRAQVRELGESRAQSRRVAADRDAAWSGQDRRLALQTADDQEARG